MMINLIGIGAACVCMALFAAIIAYRWGCGRKVPHMSPELRVYLQSYYTWATTGAPDWEPYWRWMGLCHNAPIGVRAELTDLLRAEFGQRYAYPFGGESEYHRRGEAHSQHKNPKRLAWLRRVLEIEAVS